MRFAVGRISRTAEIVYLKVLLTRVGSGRERIRRIDIDSIQESGQWKNTLKTRPIHLFRRSFVQRPDRVVGGFLKVGSQFYRRYTVRSYCPCYNNYVLASLTIILNLFIASAEKIQQAQFVLCRAFSFIMQYYVSL